MTLQINRLTSATELSLSDLIPLWSASDQDTRKATFGALLTLMQDNLTLPTATLAQQFAAPATGETVVVETGDSWLLLTPSGTLATLTVTLPTDRTDGQIVRVTSSQILTALTVGGAGTTVNGAPTAMTANGFFTMAYSATLNVWQRIG